MKQNAANLAQPRHRMRTFWAAVFGVLALWLVMASVFVVWLNRTLTDTPTFVGTVAPLVNQPAVQTFVAQRAADQLLQNSPTQDLANELLGSSQTAGKTDDQLSAMLQPVVYGSFLQLVQSPDFALLWKQTTTSAQEQLTGQLDSNSSQLTLDLNPAVVGVVGELKQTRLGPVVGQIAVSPTSGVFNLKGGGIDKAHQFYRLFKEGTVGIVLLMLLSVALAIIISVHHAKTMRRILVGTGVSSLVTAAFLEAVSIIKPNGANQAQQAAAFAIAKTLFHNLQLSLLIIGVVCLVAAAASKFSQRHRLR